MWYLTLSLTEPIESPAAVVEAEEIKSPQVKQEPTQQVTIKQEKVEEDPPLATQQAEEKIPAEVEN